MGLSITISEVQDLINYETKERQLMILNEILGSGSIKAAMALSGRTYRTYHYAVEAARKAKDGVNQIAESVPFSVPDGYKVSGMSVRTDEDGIIKGQWTKIDTDKAASAAAIEALHAAAFEDLPAIKPVSQIKNKEASNMFMNVVPIGDAHFGMLAWAEEVGEDFDLKIASEDLCGAMRQLIYAAPPAGKCLIISLGDFFHADNMAGKTAHSGNILDMDGRLPKMISAGVKAVRQLIKSALETHKKVEFIAVQGNHDEVLANALAIMLDHIYEEDDRVYIHTSPAHRHYVKHGEVLIGATHGHETKDANLPVIMANEQKKAWAKTSHRFFYRGHHHQDKVVEYTGCKVEQFRTLAAGDSYAVHHGYSSGRDMKLITMHKKYGEVSRNTCSIDMLRDLYKNKGGL